MNPGYIVLIIITGLLFIVLVYKTIIKHNRSNPNNANLAQKYILDIRQQYPHINTNNNNLFMHIIKSTPNIYNYLPKSYKTRYNRIIATYKSTSSVPESAIRVAESIK